LKTSFDLFQESFAATPLGMEITDGREAVERIGCAVPVMKIEVEDEGAFDLLLTEKFLDGNSNIVEIAEPPAGMGAGMVSQRPN
jgi:hypothetical protein